MQSNKKLYMDVNECTSRGSCSLSPSIASLEFLSMHLLRQIAYYLLKLDDLGASNYKIKRELINDIAMLVSVNDFSEDELYSAIMSEYFMLDEVKNTYSNFSKKLNQKPRLLKSIKSVSQKMTLAQAISTGEKLIAQNYGDSLKNLSEILNTVVKSLCVNHIKLMDFEIFDEDCYKKILKALNLFNYKLSEKVLIQWISDVAIMDKNLQLRISNVMLETFGPISEVNVSHSTKKGKAILVSGNNFFDLLKILKLTEGKNIDVYTHSNLLITHSLNSFKKFEHLRGHYGDETENCILDFATFPGAILLTKDSHGNNEYLYRGRLFSKDYIIPKGVKKIENDDYYPVLDAALEAKGFSKGKVKKESIVGFDLDEIDKKFSSIVGDLDNNKIKRLYIVGLNAHSELQKEYFKEFFDSLNSDEFVISFSYSKENSDNIYNINVGNYTPFVTTILKRFFDKYSLDNNNIVFLLTTCDVMSISGVIALKSLGAKKVYMAQCPPTTINPSVYKTFSNLYNIQTTETVASDLKNLRK